MKIKAKQSGGVVKVKALIKHPMETGQRKDKKSGKVIPAKFIQTVTATANGKTVFVGNLNTGVSKDPFLAFSYKGNSGDAVTMSWQDSTGATGEGSTTAK